MARPCCLDCRSSGWRPRPVTLLLLLLSVRQFGGQSASRAPTPTAVGVRTKHPIRSLTDEPACSAEEGSTTSAVYPCRCGEAVCVNEQFCTKSSSTCADAEQESCPTSVVMKGPTSVQLSKMGTFTLLNMTPTADARRGIYQKPAGPYLFYWEEFGEWRVGDDYERPESYITSGPDRAWCPTEVVVWHDWVDGAWNKDDPDISLVALGPSESVDDGTATDDGTAVDYNTSAAPYDCAARETIWETGWSQSKKDWCCENHKYCEGEHYVNAGAGYCRGSSGKYTNFYWQVNSSQSHLSCRAQCDTDAECVAYNAVRGGACTIWVPRVSVAPAGWTFGSGSGAAEITEGRGDSQKLVFCMIKASHALSPSAEEIEGRGFLFWLLWAIIPCLTIICAGMCMILCQHNWHNTLQARGASISALRMRLTPGRRGAAERPLHLSGAPLQAEGDS